MSRVSRRIPVLDSFYQTYLESEDAAQFIAEVSSHYTLATLRRLLVTGSRNSRRAAALAIGFLGDMSVNPALGRALHDRDRGVRMIAEHVIQDLWFRDGMPEHRAQLQAIARWNDAGQYRRSIQQAGLLIRQAASLAELWNQRAIAYFQTRRYSESIRDCRQTLRLNPFHFGAIVGMGNCYLEMNNPMAALRCFRRALRVNPNMEDVRVQVDFLARALEER